MVSKNIKTRLLIKLIALGLIPHYAFALSQANFLYPKHTIVSLGGGVAIATDVGDSQRFNVSSPIPQGLYIYQANHTTQTVKLLDGFVGGEWAVQPTWLLQLGLDFNQSGNFKPRGTFIQGADLASADQYAYSYQISSQQLLVESKLLYQLQEKLFPYLMFGLGASFNRSSNYNTSVSDLLTYTRLYQSNTQSSFSYRSGIGIDADISKCLRLGLGYRFTDLGKVKLGSATINATPVGGTLSQSHLYAHEILAQLTIQLDAFISSQ